MLAEEVMFIVAKYKFSTNFLSDFQTIPYEKIWFHAES